MFTKTKQLLRAAEFMSSISYNITGVITSFLHIYCTCKRYVYTLLAVQGIQMGYLSRHRIDYYINIKYKVYTVYNSIAI